MSIETEIINQTEIVRERQKSYFSTRTVTGLSQAKKEEEKLDRMIAEYKKIQLIKELEVF